MEALVEVAGWLGAALVLTAYGLISRGTLTGGDPRYQTLNVLGAALIGWNCVAHRAWPSFVVNVVWLAIAVVALTAARLTAGARQRRSRVAGTGNSTVADAALGPAAR